MDESLVKPLSSQNLLTASLRILPSFLIVGLQKSGSTSLVQYLNQHQQIVPALRKDIYFFNNPTRFNKGEKFYRAFFPLRSKQKLIEFKRRKKTFTFDGTPNYFDVPGAATHIKKMLPNAKIIIMFRDPVARAYSNYTMAVKFGFETLPFYDALQLEDERIAWFEKSKFYKGHNIVYQRLAYKKRGEYSNFLPEWRQTFGNNLHIDFTENLNKNPSDTYAKILRFLHLEEQKVDFVQYNKGAYREKIDDKTKEFLQNHYKNYNLELAKQLNCSLPW